MVIVQRRRMGIKGHAAEDFAILLEAHDDEPIDRDHQKRHVDGGRGRKFRFQSALRFFGTISENSAHDTASAMRK